MSQNEINNSYKYSDITGKVIGCAMEVHRYLGNGFQEVIYQRALTLEMQEQGLSFSREHEMQIKYKGFDIGTRRVDFFVEEKERSPAELALYDSGAVGFDRSRQYNHAKRLINFRSLGILKVSTFTNKHDDYALAKIIAQINQIFAGGDRNFICYQCLCSWCGTPLV
jgi:hypothetical protein